MNKFKERFDAIMIDYIFEKLLTKEHHPMNLKHLERLDTFFFDLNDMLEEENIDIEYTEDIAAILFLSDKLMSVLKDQTYFDTEFYAYARSMKYFVDDLRNRLLQIENEH